MTAVGSFDSVLGVPFVAFDKIGRLKRQIVVTEKIDGTNAQVYVGEDGVVLAGSRTRVMFKVTIEKDDEPKGAAARGEVA